MKWKRSSWGKLKENTGGARKEGRRLTQGNTEDAFEMDVDIERK